MTERPDVVWHHGEVSPSDRHRITGGRGLTVWLTGLSGAGKSTIGALLERRLVGAGRLSYRLDGDNVRHGLNDDLGFSAADRRENVRRLGEVARLMADAGVVAIVAAISPFAEDRLRVRRLHEDACIPFVEAYVDAPMDVCESRDPKGLYRRARSGELSGLTGVDAPYEPPPVPDVHVRTDQVSPEAAVTRILDVVRERTSGTEG